MADRRVLGVLAGTDMPLSRLRHWVNSSQVVFAADGGANRLLALGRVPDVTIGDFDSISEQARRHAISLQHAPDQDHSDCDKLLAAVAEAGHVAITLASVEGDLLDHTLGTLSSALRSPLRVRLALRKGIAWILRTGDRVVVDVKVGARASLMPLLPETMVTFEGVHWPLRDTTLSPLGLTSLSNRAETTQISAEVHQGAAMLFVARTDPFWEDA